MVTTATEPTEADIAAWLPGSRTVRQAQADFGLSRNRLFALMKSGTLRWKVVDEQGARLIAVVDLARYVAGLPNGGV